MTDVPLSPKPKQPTDPMTEGFGPIGAKPQPDRERSRYDIPSRPDDDFAIDEQRIRRRATPPRDEGNSGEA
ncbi:hypothetical protein SAMN05444004_11184 [Jannaschia faecimaris]|uniref:Uncharacterized protein n=1 Tax=Jannaschia faecimaris TaxID=1244108 RepID=A0A1H3SCF2_9RHOB|nr:hypothetical protein [Jannaschia faecimaris]SDZ35702.1 hypothetical protein SAMN05444004_11184 [Jannaschia faecimaris]